MPITIKANGPSYLEPVIGRPAPEGKLFRCSSLGKYLDCPGSYNAEEFIENETNAAAESGTLCHLVSSLVINMATMSNPDLLLEAQDAQVIAHNLDAREAWVVRWYTDQVAYICQEHGGVNRIEFELPIEVPVSSGVIRGHFDLLMFMNDGTVHVSDLKSGRLSQATAEVTVQGQAYCLGISREYNLDSITMHIIAAGNETEQQHTECTYYRRHLEGIYTMLLSVTERAANPHAPRVPSPESCKYCRALATDKCPESVIYLERSERRLRHVLSDVEAMFPHADMDEVNKLISMGVLCEQAGKKMKKVSKKFLKENPDLDCGWTLGKARKRRKFKKGVDVLNEVKSRKVLTKKRMLELGAGKVTVSDVEKELVKQEADKCDAKGDRPAKPLDTIHKFTDACKDIIETTTDDPPLAKATK